MGSFKKTGTGSLSRLFNCPLEFEKQVACIVRRCLLLLAVVALSGVGCRSILAHRLLSDVRASAIVYAEDLKKKGSLPGFAPDDHGSMSISTQGMLLGTGIKYPLTVTVWARKDSENATYAYALLKGSSDMEWKLIGAWKRIEGKTVWYMDQEKIAAAMGEKGHASSNVEDRVTQEESGAKPANNNKQRPSFSFYTLLRASP